VRMVFPAAEYGRVIFEGRHHTTSRPMIHSPSVIAKGELSTFRLRQRGPGWRVAA
jgi:hypothetical protein